MKENRQHIWQDTHTHTTLPHSHTHLALTVSLCQEPSVSPLKLKTLCQQTVLPSVPPFFYNRFCYCTTAASALCTRVGLHICALLFLSFFFFLVMYIGQVMKDLLKLPRPVSPPVVKLETRVDAEYGLPSTHAMAATSISFTLLFSAPSRLQFQFEVGLLIAVTLSSLVCLSRLYTGMHSVLDVICGVVISAVILLLTYPCWETLDHLQLHTRISPIAVPALLLFLCYKYPDLDHYSTTRGDTTTILGACAGSSVGYWVNEQLGETFEPQGTLPVPLPTLTANALALCTGRFLVGVVALVGTRQIVKTTSLHVLYSWYRVPKNDHNARRRKEIEVPYKFTTYTAVGLVHSILTNRIFVLLGLL
uniref:Sphingosine-1-phosphate phosphatase 2 n=1 Tax=Amphiprion ocellaris TaxID=80972 RepID=A0AAQ5YY83_AMPOC